MDSTVDVDDILDSPTTEFGRVVVLSTISALSRLAMHFMNRTTVHNDKAVRLLQERPDERSLITVSNHTSTVDDPCLPCALLPFSFFFHEANHKGTRWTFCADDICYKNIWRRMFFQSGKVLPIKRGGGLEQDTFSVVAKRLGTHGDWLHVFPEGRISYDGRLADFRRGVGRMVCDTMKHGDGMADMMPYKARFPRWGHNITVTFGDPVDLSDLTCKCNREGCNQEKLWHAITQRIRASLLDLEERSVKNPDQVASGRVPSRHVHAHGGASIPEQRAKG